MPTWMPEGDVPSSQDTEWRSLQKIAALAYALYGPVPWPMYPEGTQPLASDGEDRLRLKINKLLNP